MRTKLVFLAVAAMMVMSLSTIATTSPMRAAAATAAASDATAARPMAQVLQVTNNTPCPVTVCVICADGRVFCITVPPFAVGVLAIPCDCVIIRIVVIIHGIGMPIPPGGCVHNVDLGGCCADVCFDPGTNTVTANQVPGPCP